MLGKSVYVLLRISGISFLNIYISADIYIGILEYQILKSPYICIGIGLKNPISVGALVPIVYRETQECSLMAEAFYR